jgi:antitoxin component YwqK of YwqJK toxin-antitoxin module
MRLPRVLPLRALLAIVPPLLLPAPARAQVLDCEVGGQAVNPSNGSTTAGRTGLMRCVDRSTRELLREEELRNGRFVGVQRWYEGGRLRREVHIDEQGNREGRWREWNAAGVLVREGFDANGRSVGLHRQWAGDGRLVSTSHWGDAGDAGQRGEAPSRMDFNPQGQLTRLECGAVPRLEREPELCGHRGQVSVAELFGERGVLAARVVHERGQRLRIDSYWDSGQPRSSEWREGTRQTARQFDRNGTLRKERVQDGPRPVLEREFGERGTLVTERRWDAEGALEREAQWYLNGQLQREVLHPPAAADGSRTRTERGYRDDGRLAFEGRWLAPARGRGVPVGSHKRWDESGRLRQETVYDAQGRLQRERSWSETGLVLRDDEVHEDGSRKNVGPNAGPR